MELDSDILNVITDKSKATRRGRSVYKERGGSQAMAEAIEERYESIKRSLRGKAEA